jgi:hypothetical protein
MRSIIGKIVGAMLLAALALGFQATLLSSSPFGASTSAKADVPLDGLTPTIVLGSYSGNTGFVAQVTNFDPAYTWSLATSQGNVFGRLPSRAGVAFSIAVTNLPLDQSATLTVTTSRSGYADASASIVGYSKKTGLTPTFSSVVPSYGSYTVQITNYTSDFTWFAASTNGSASMSNTGLITVSSLGDHLIDSLTVTTSGADYASVVTTVSATVLPANTALTPSLGGPTSTETSISIPILNFDPDFTWAASTAGAGTVNISSDGVVTITDLYGGQSITLSVTSSRTGYRDGSAQVQLLSLYSARNPELWFLSRDESGFIITIYDFTNAYEWSVTSDAGSATIDSAGLVHVTGLLPGQSATITVTTTRTNGAPGSGTTTDSAATATYTPIMGTPVRLANGFAVQVTNFAPGFTWALTTEGSIGTAEISETGLITVSGLQANESTTVYASPSQFGYDTNGADVTATALATGLTPFSGSVVRVEHGFTSQLTNYDGAFGWSASTSVGSATIANTGLITVSGLTSNATATVTVTTTREGYVTETLSIQGQALESVDPDPAPGVDAENQVLANLSAKALAEYKAAMEALKQQRQEAELAKAAAKASADNLAVRSLLSATPATLVRELRKLTADQVALIPVSTFKKLSDAALRALRSNQAAGITQAQLRSLSPAKLSKLSPAVIGELKPAVLGSLSIAKLKALTRAQAKSIWLAQLIELDADQRKALRR